MTEHKYPDQEQDEPQEMLTTDQVRSYLDEGGLLMRTEGIRFAYRRKQVKNYVLYVNGVSCEVGAHEGGFIKALCDHSAISGDDITSQETLEIVTELLNMEALCTESYDEALEEEEA